MDDPDKIPAFLLPYRGEKLLAGFSGGCDSTALLLLLHRWGWRGALLEAVHFDHGLRGEASRQDALWCEDFCRARDIAFRKIELRLAPGPDLEAAARASRLAYYRRIAPVAVALAHHADDAAETLLLRLARGSNVSALAALRPVRKLGQVTLLRPLLGRRRAELEAFLRSEGVTDWRNDASNRDNHFARNRLRNELLPALYRALPPARKGLLRALSALTLDAEYLEQCAEEKLREIGDARVTPTAFWRGLPPALLARILRRHLERHLGDGVLLSGAMTERFVRELHTAHPGGARFHLGRGAAFRIAGNRLELLAPEAPPSRLPAECRWEWRREPECRWGDWLLSARTREDPNVTPADELVITLVTVTAFETATAMPGQPISMLPPAAATSSPREGSQMALPEALR